MTHERLNAEMVKTDDFIARLREELGRHGRSQSALARAIGLQASAVNRIVNGRRALKAAERDQIEAYLEETDPVRHPTSGQEAAEALIALTPIDDERPLLISMGNVVERGLTLALEAISDDLKKPLQMAGLSTEKEDSLHAKIIASYILGIITDSMLPDFRLIADVRKAAVNSTNLNILESDTFREPVANLVAKYTKADEGVQDASSQIDVGNTTISAIKIRLAFTMVCVGLTQKIMEKAKLKEVSPA